MNIKGLKTYSVPVFRGLDKENKLLKVAPFRAADGKNFILDSDTLRTRPAIKYSDEIPFALEQNDFVIDWYRFRNVTLYITRFHIYVDYNGTVSREDSADFILGNFGTIDFNNFETLFQEEKEALFIFGLGDIFVFSYVQTQQGVPHRYVFYSLKSKPVNTFTVDGSFFNQFRDLPEAYEPTVFLGTNRFDDINLLSNIRRYKLFASSGDITEGGLQSYYLPSDYSFDKHGEFDFGVTFYEGRYQDLQNIYPIFVGVEGENFDDGTLFDYGVVLNPNNKIDIQDIFYPKAQFEFFGTSADQNPTVISKIVGMDRNWFLQSRIFNDSSKDVFNFLLEYIRKNAATLIGFNRMLVFNVTIEYTAVYKNAQTNYVVETRIERGNIDVYVQLKSLDIDSLDFEQEETLASSILITQDANNTTFPVYPTTTGTFDQEFDVSSSPILTPSLSINEFKNAATTLLRQNRELLTDGELVKVKGQYFEYNPQTQNPTANINTDFNQWYFFRENTIANQNILANLPDKNTQEYSPTTSFASPAYPTVTADRTIDLNANTFIVKPNNEAFTQSDFETLANNYINNNIQTFTSGETVALRAKYLENKTKTIAASSSLSSTPTNEWGGYFGYTYPSQSGIASTLWFSDLPTVTLPTINSNDTSDTFYTTQFVNHFNNNKAFYRQYYNQLINTKLTTNQTTTQTTYEVSYNNWIVNPQWTLFTGSFPPYSQTDFINVSGSANSTFRFYLDPAAASSFTFVIVSTSGDYTSVFQFYDSNFNPVFIGSYPLSDYYSGSISGHSVPFTKPINAVYMKIRLFHAPFSETNTVINGINNTWDDRVEEYVETPVQTTTVTGTTTKYSAYFVAPDGTIETQSVTADNSGTFPAFIDAPNMSTSSVINPFFLTYNNPSNKDTFFNESAFRSALTAQITAKIDAEILTPSSGTGFAKVYVQGTHSSGFYGTSLIVRFTYARTGPQDYQLRQAFVMTAEVTTIISEDEIVTFNDPSTIDGGLYPEFPNPNNNDIVEVPLITQEGEEFLYGSTLINAVQNYLITVVDTLTGVENNQYNGFAKVKIQTEYLNSTKGNSIVIPFTYSKSYTLDTYRRQSFVYTTEIDRVQEVIGNDLFEFFFDEMEKRFELRLKDYFYDYNNEPSITVRIEYQRNPDYDLIAKTRFGATFGSENRLFLAGHPDFPNIDRFNVSNDLLGGNLVQQSYEHSYFPSKNYRVLGGKGAINGYVTATDSLLYVTKEEYPNDDRLFIRQRVLDENGVVGYNEFKTSVNKTPLNHKSIVRFNNDIVMLTKDGLYALEISENVLTDERLLKLRSGFINKELIEKVKAYDHNKIFILENNLYMYIFIGTDLYVADSRYTDRNPNNIIENLSYEIMYWDIPKTFKTGKIDQNTFKILNETGKFIYTLDQNQNFDDKLERYFQVTNTIDFGNENQNAFAMPVVLQEVVADPEKYSIEFDDGYKVIGKENVDYTINNGVVTYINDLSFRMIENGQTYFFKDANDNFYPFTVSDSIPFKSFNFNPATSGDKDVIYQNIANVPLYVTMVFTFLGVNYVRLSPYKPTEIIKTSRIVPESDTEYTARLLSLFKDNEDYFFKTSGMKDLIVNEEKPIEMLWISGITDFGNRLMEKKSYKFNIYATKKENENTVTIGYTTRRRGFEETKNTLSVSNPNTFKRTNLSNYAMTTFRETGFSVPMKENNFLYMQILIEGVGQIEVNGFDILYIDNRLLKSVA
jgi:hypothetical protein